MHKVWQRVCTLSLHIFYSPWLQLLVATWMYFVSFLCDELLIFRPSSVPPVASNPGDATVWVGWAMKRCVGFLLHLSLVFCRILYLRLPNRRIIGTKFLLKLYWFIFWGFCTNMQKKSTKGSLNFFWASVTMEHKNKNLILISEGLKQY